MSNQERRDNHGVRIHLRHFKDAESSLGVVHRPFGKSFKTSQQLSPNQSLLVYTGKKMYKDCKTLEHSIPSTGNNEGEEI